MIALIKGTLEAQQISPSEAKWLNPKDTSQVNWAIEYLKKRPSLPDYLHAATPSTLNEKSAFILATLDQPMTHALERKYFMDSMRRAWTQYKYRHTGKPQRQVYFSLGKAARDKLQASSEYQNRRNSEIVEEPILKHL